MEILSTIEKPDWRFSDIDIFVWRRQRKPRTANIILRSYPSAGDSAFAAWTSLPVPSQTVHQLDFFPGDG